jgi:hypothetical protein
MILRELDNTSLYRLLRPELRALPADEGGGFSRVHWRGYRLHYLARAMWIRRGDRHVTVWDMGPYYQCPFVEACHAWEVLSEDDLARIAAMKEKRASFRDKDRTKVRSYCLSECKALASLATHLEAAHRAAGIKPRAWHGPGSTAAALLRSEGIAEKRGPEWEDLPRGMADAAGRAYFGGRFEQRLSGEVKGRVMGYDIASAYPYHAWRLPCLEHGEWHGTTKERDVERSAQAIVRGHIVAARGDWAPLPVRLLNGNIVFPRSGASGWWYKDEWLAARRGWPGLEFAEAFTLRKQCDCRPFSFLARLYAERQKMGKSGRGKVLKLATNSVYGKLTQTIGRPQFSSRLWAGMITSGTRAQLLHLMLRHKKLASVLAVATDGLYSREDVDLPQSEADPLGAWEPEEHDGLVLVRPGIYWSKDGITRARGLGRKTLDADRALVLRALRRHVDHVALAPRTVFGAARVSVYRTPTGVLRRSEHYGQWHAIPSRISLQPFPKRDARWGTHVLDDIESAPYRAKQASSAGALMALLGALREAVL